ncbi:DUF4294 domain-containing protein [Rurimicrobium arvi]|uniref:DUF4294 domain-containing protein n=1 Tax=Rurimicrobium arvi TaxID=2049916 RepID=A0ABP8MGA5_9BACT
MKQTALYIRLLLLSLAFLLCGAGAYAQDTEEDGIKLPAVVVGTDTFPIVYLNEVLIYEHLSPADRRRLRRQARREERRQSKYDAEYARLKYNVYKVYPYANTAAYLLKDVHEKLAAIPSKEGRKKYLKGLEKELNKRFKGELQEFTISQGIVLVKLINRQTGRNCFDIISEVKGGFNAVVWQGVALVFGNNLRREYEPEGRDHDIEQIVRELEANAAAAAKRS